MEEKRKACDLDRVTGLMRKGAFLDALDARIASAEADGTLKDYVLVCSNICNFKYYNIKYGSQAGDGVLRALSQWIVQTDPDALCGRFISDRFIVLSRQADLEDRIRRVQQAFKDAYGGDGLKLKAGLLQMTAGVRAAEACELANLTCGAIRNQPEDFHYYDEQINRHAANVVYIVQNVDRAIREGWIQVDYQPMVRTVNDALCGVEALTRWVDPERGLIKPKDYVPVLEDNQLITRLDLYVLDRVCQDMAQWMAEGRPLVPVSVNLSRIDFLRCDIVSEVEDCVARYGIARDMLGLEVTESMVMADSDVLKQDMKRFREMGYELFMDDFGSGYSSLTVLRDYEFDVIKLDMIFLRNFDDKSKRVIRSAVSMAKGLGLQVLAEGVEDAAAYAFLKDIGCDRVQGYYFSPPLPLAKLGEIYTKFEHIEGRRFKGYYGSVSALNFLTDKPMEIIDFDGEAFHSLYANAPAQAVWQSLNFNSQAQVYELVNNSASPYFKEIRTNLGKLRLDDPIRMEYDIYGTFVSLQSELLAKEGGHRLLLIETANLGQKDEEDQGDENYIFRLLYTTFDEIYLINLETLEFEPIKPGVNYLEMSEEWDKRNWRMDVKAAAKLFIQMEDQGDYVKFADPGTMKARMAKADGGVLTQMFRSKGRNGAYIMKLHTLQPMPGSARVLYTTRFVPMIQKQMANKNWRYARLSEMDADQQDIRKTLRHSRTMNLFWKDSQRRFVDVNDKFMETYGIEDRAEILGKTDEDMHWHLDDAPFRNDEIEVLQEGKPARNRLGQCIIRGEIHDIMASKEPVYHDGEVVGLLGAFMPVDEIAPQLAERPSEGDGTELKSALTISAAAEAYMEGWEFRGEKFAALSLQLNSYKRARQTYGGEIAGRMVKAVNRLIAACCRNRAVAGRIYGEHFLVLMKYTDRQDVAAFAQELTDRLRGVRELDGYTETLSPAVAIYYAEDAGSVAELMTQIYQEAKPKLSSKRMG